MGKAGMWGAVATALVLSTGIASGQGKNSPTCGTDKVATVVVHLQDDAGATPALLPDGTGPYGGSSKENVRLQIDNCTFDLVMNFSTSRRRVLAKIQGATVPLTLLNFDRVGSVPLGLTAESAFCTPVGAISGDAKAPQDNYAGCGKDERGVYVRRTLTAQIEGREDRRLVMQTSPFDGHSKPLIGYCDAPDPSDDPMTCFTSYVRVYRDAPGQWTLIPEPATHTGTPIAVENLHASTGVDPQGTHLLPFKITVTTP